MGDAKVVKCSSFLFLGLYLAGAAASNGVGRELLDNQCSPMEFADLKPVTTHAPVMDLYWVGQDDKTVFALTHKMSTEYGGVWRSINGGNDFAELTPKLNASISGAEPITVMGVFSQKSSQGNVLLLNSGSYMWVSKDFGETFTPLQTPTKWKGSGIRGLRMHPRHDNWLLLLVKRPDCKTIDKAVMECPHDLMVNTDVFNPNGAGWQNLTANSKGKIAGFVDFDWAANLCPKDDCKDLPHIDDNTIFATMYAKPGDYDMPWDPDVHFVASTNYFKSFQTHVMCGNMFELVGRSVYLAFANGCPTDINGKKAKGSSYAKGITLYTSLDVGTTFTQACLPVALKQEGYELVETHDGRGAVIIVDFVVDAGFMDLPASSVYTAGPHHALFSLSLTDVFHSEFGFTTDFARIEGMPGTYIANQLVPRPSSSTEPSADDYYYDLSDLTEAPLVETRITFNSGGHWQRLLAPTKISNPKCDRCGGKSPCYLHLHGMSSWNNMGSSLPAVYSNPSAPGFIMGTGNVGPLGMGLDDNDGLCTWLSSDGGVSWIEVADGPYIYEFADWGGLIVMMRHPGMTQMGPTAAADEVRFSTDYGRCWQSVPLSEAIVVDNIRIEPDGQRPRVIAHGRACRNTINPKCRHGANDTDANTMEGIMYTVDVQTLMASKSMGLCAPSDYEPWNVPSDKSTPRCVLGQTMQLQRRKQGSLCLNGPDYKRPAPVTTPCQCTPEDTECDYGFVRMQDKCVAISPDRMPQCPVIDSKTYAVSSNGKRLVHADVCTNSAGLFPDTDGKGTKTQSKGHHKGGGSTTTAHHSAWFGIMMALLVALAFGGIFYGWWRYMATETQQDTVRDVFSSVGSFFANLWSLIVDKIRGRRGAPAEELGYFQPLGDPGHDLEGRNVFTLK